jgi:hypothetical protein
MNGIDAAREIMRISTEREPLSSVPYLGWSSQVSLIHSEQVIEHIECVHQRPKFSCFIHLL